MGVREGKGNRAPRPPRRLSVTLTVASGSKLKYADVMKEVRTVKLKELGIEDIRCRRSITRAMIIEVPGKENVDKADKLAAQLKGVFQNCQEVRVNRPEKMAEIRIRDID